MKTPRKVTEVRVHDGLWRLAVSDKKGTLLLRRKIEDQTTPLYLMDDAGTFSEPFKTRVAAREFVLRLAAWHDALVDELGNRLVDEAMEEFFEPLAGFRASVEEASNEHERSRQAAVQAVLDARRPTLRRRVAQRLAYESAEVNLSETEYWQWLTDRARKKYLDLADEIIDMVREG